MKLSILKLSDAKYDAKQNETKRKRLNIIQDGLFWGCSWMGGTFWPPFPKIRHTYPTMMKLGTVISYLRKIQKKYKSCDTFLEFC